MFYIDWKNIEVDPATYPISKLILPKCFSEESILAELRVLRRNMHDDEKNPSISFKVFHTQKESGNLYTKIIKTCNEIAVSHDYASPKNNKIYVF